jgi:short-subunit dehydrogenase
MSATSKSSSPAAPAKGTAVVTGAGGGLGAAFCAELRTRGYRVIATDVRGAERILDVTSAAACRALAEDVAPDVWINNAGVLGAGSAIDQPDAEIERLVAVNLMGVIHGSRAAALGMRARGRGHILNVGSLASWVAPPGETVYAATKHAVRAFSFGLAAELRGSGVHVSLLCPDGIDSPMLVGREHDPHAAMSFTAARLLTPAEVAHAGLRLLDHPRLMRSVPAFRGLAVRVIGAIPAANQLVTRVMAIQGRRAQARRAKQEVGK